jgi:hypothetical protein
MKALLWPATAILCALIIAYAITHMLTGRFQTEMGRVGPDSWVLDTWTGKVCKARRLADKTLWHSILGYPKQGDCTVLDLRHMIQDVPLRFFVSGAYRFGLTDQWSVQLRSEYRSQPLIL